MKIYQKLQELEALNKLYQKQLSENKNQINNLLNRKISIKQLGKLMSSAGYDVKLDSVIYDISSVHPRLKLSYKMPNEKYFKTSIINLCVDTKTLINQHRQDINIAESFHYIQDDNKSIRYTQISIKNPNNLFVNLKDVSDKQVLFALAKAIDSSVEDGKAVAICTL